MKKFEEPMFKVIVVNSQDVITTSGYIESTASYFVSNDAWGDADSFVSDQFRL